MANASPITLTDGTVTHVFNPTDKINGVVVFTDQTAVTLPLGAITFTIAFKGVTGKTVVDRIDVSLRFPRIASVSGVDSIVDFATYNKGTFTIPPAWPAALRQKLAHLVASLLADETTVHNMIANRVSIW